jgi:hypothetical protein
MAERFEIEIGENTYHVRKYEPFLSLEILGELQKHFLAPLTSALEAKDSKNEAEAMGVVSDSLEKLSRNLDGKTLVALAKMVLLPDYVAVSIGDKEAQKLTPGALNMAVADVGELIELFIAVVRHNYESVFTSWAGRIGSALKSKGNNPLAKSAMN